MKTKLFALLTFFVCVTCSAAPVHLTVTQPLTPVKTALTNLSQEAGVPILADNTVVDTLGVTDITQPTVDDVLDALKKFVPALSWQKIYLSKTDVLPDPDALSAQVRTLQASNFTNITIVDPAKRKATMFFHTAETPSTVPAGMQAVYLVTNETVRKQRDDAKQKAAEAKAAASATPVGAAVSSLQNSADQLAAMTPDEQRQALPLMFQQFQQMMQSIDPSVMNDLRNQMRQQRQNGPPSGQ